jgi:pilus assembly protein FimV
MTRITLAIVAAALWLTAPVAAHAAGLGRLTVLSPLGQPLNAEIEIVSLRPGEEDGLSARLASPEAFKQAGIDPNAALNSMRFALEQRGARRFIRVSTAQPVNEPFLDLLVELQWNAGRLVREYTVLLDPPDYRGTQAIAATPAPAQATTLTAKPLAPVEATPAAGGPQAEPKSAAAEPASTETAAAETSAAAASANASAPAAQGGYAVKPGDTLGGIAREHMPPGMTLNQMLIAIYRANPDAFIRENVNLVRAGRVLEIPTGESLGTVNLEEANRLVRAHHAEFNEYRSRLAAAPVAVDAAPGQRAVEGQIEAKPDAPAPAAADQLRLSKADPAKGGGPAARAAQEDDAAARERALEEAQSRVADLEKNVADLQKLLELKNQQLAELEKQATAKSAAAAPGPSSPTPAAITPVQAPAPAAQPSQSSAPQASKAPATQAAKPAPKKTASAPPAAPSLIDEFLDNPLALPGLALIVLLLAGYGIWSWRRKRAGQTQFQDSVLGTAGAAAAFGAGTGDASASQESVNQPVAGMDSEEVDPIAEADVYMAYGRDAQAEEILKEALQKDAKRIPVHAKLLEIYAHRKDSRSFEETALKLKNLTGGVGAEWDKAAVLGRSVDPGNGLYGSAASAAAPVAAARAAAVAAAAPALDFDLGASTSPGTSLPDLTLGDRKDEISASSPLDFDLGADSTGNGNRTSDFTPEGTLIMDKGAPEKSAGGGLDFNLDLGEEVKKEAPAAVMATAVEPSGGLDFDLDLDIGNDKSPSPAVASAPSMDLSDISLDLGSVGEPSASGADNDPKWQEVATKLDLAKAYEEMGDRDGARELLGEVMKDGDSSQKGQAEQLLAKLS